MSALPQITADGYRKHLGPADPENASEHTSSTTRASDLLLVATPRTPQPHEAQLAPVPRDEAPPLARGTGGSYLDLDAHRRNNALHYVLLALDAEIVGCMRSGDLDGAQRIQHIVAETKRRIG